MRSTRPDVIISTLAFQYLWRTWQTSNYHILSKCVLFKSHLYEQINAIHLYSTIIWAIETNLHLFQESVLYVGSRVTAYAHKLWACLTGVRQGSWARLGRLLSASAGSSLPRYKSVWLLSIDLPPGRSDLVLRVLKHCWRFLIYPRSGPKPSP